MLDLIIITPTIGRKTLKNSIDSIKNIKDGRWKSIIVFDGIKKNIEVNDNRFIILERKKTGEKNYAGSVRNIAMKYILDNKIESRFVCFLDDDDTLSPDYIKNLNIEIRKTKNIELIIFRMMGKYDSNNYIFIPDERIKGILKCRVGISFCIKYDLIKKYKFINDQYEDFEYLKNIDNNNHKIVISRFVNYFVKDTYANCKKYIKIFPRIRINY